MNDADTENHLEVYGDSDWKDGWPETIVVFNTKTRADEVYVRYRSAATAETARKPHEQDVYAKAYINDTPIAEFAISPDQRLGDVV